MMDETATKTITITTLTNDDKIAIRSTSLIIDHEFRFQIHVDLRKYSDGCSVTDDNDKDDEGNINNHHEIDEQQDSIVPPSLIDQFHRDGFVVIPNVLNSATVKHLNDRLEHILRGHYDRGHKPDKSPKLIKGVLKKSSDHPNNTNSNNTNSNNKRGGEGRNTGTVGPIGFSGNLQNVKVLQLINVHKCDTLFRAVETNLVLGHVVAQLAGWTTPTLVKTASCCIKDHDGAGGGTRLGQDQIWAKPPGAAPLVFHRDSPYFMFHPAQVVTVWVALDDMEEEVGPLEYVRGSHHWGDGRSGSANQFFQSGTAGCKALLLSAAQREGVTDMEIVTMAGLKAGGISIHNGRTWHGSSKNTSTTRPRRGLGLHFIPANAKFTCEASKSRLWRSYVENVDDPSTMPLPNEDFPITWQPTTEL